MRGFALLGVVAADEAASGGPSATEGVRMSMRGQVAGICPSGRQATIRRTSAARIVAFVVCNGSTRAVSVLLAAARPYAALGEAPLRIGLSSGAASALFSATAA